MEQIILSKSGRVLGELAMRKMRERRMGGGGGFVDGTLRSSSSSYSSNGDEWEREELENGRKEEGEENPNRFYDKFIPGSVPSIHEVEEAISALQQFLASASNSELADDRFVVNSNEDVADQIANKPNGLMPDVTSVEPQSDLIMSSLHQYGPGILQSGGFKRVHDAFGLLQREPFLKRVIASLSTDKALWDAVLNNEVVRELIDSFFAVGNDRGGSSDGKPDAATIILKWVLDQTKAKVKELIEIITKLLSEVLYEPLEKDKTNASATDLLEDTLRSSLLLSIMVLLIVMVKRVGL